MAYLIDTHTLLWHFNGDKQMSNSAMEILKDNRQEKYTSIASVWEIAIKISIGKLLLEFSFDEIEVKLAGSNISLLHISVEHTQKIISLPLHHRDPFDRMIIAQSITENLTIISKDKNFSLYPIKLLW
jgi:PIN domain nuclease of toxin-antitoxin system